MVTLYSRLYFKLVSKALRDIFMWIYCWEEQEEEEEEEYISSSRSSRSSIRRSGVVGTC